MRQRDPNRGRSLSDDSGIIIGVLVAALVIIVGTFLFWPRGDTNPGTAMRDDSPRTERAPVTPQPAPTKPAQ
jgi:hypothetical protein